MRIVVLPAPGHERLASQLASNLGAEPGFLETRRFPDAERYVRVASDVRNAHVVIAASLRDPDPQLAGLLFLADAARELGAAKVGLAAPYLAYLRQDRRFRDGEAITSRTFAKALSRFFDWVATVDPHLHRYHSLGEIYSIPGLVAHAAPQLARWIGANVAHPVVVGPDGESAQWADEVARGAGCPATVLTKERHGDRDVEVSVPLAEVRGRTPVLVDDIISSARTMAQAARALSSAGGSTPICVGIHAVFADGAEEALRSAGVARVVTCNTIEHPTNEIDVLAAFAAALRSRFLSVAP
jgi:ribose-phosphate pyrophosphokinase